MRFGSRCEWELDGEDIEADFEANFEALKSAHETLVFNLESVWCGGDMNGR